MADAKPHGLGHNSHINPHHGLDFGIGQDRNDGPHVDERLKHVIELMQRRPNGSYNDDLMQE